MTETNKTTELERIVIASMLEDPDLKPSRSTVNFGAVTVVGRDFTGVGFLTEFMRSEELKAFETDVSLRWGKVGARLNASKVETGYLVYVDDGYVTAVEGYTYDENWPNPVEEIDMYELRPGMELGTTSK